MTNKDGGGGTILRFYGGDTAVMRGDIELMGESPNPPLLGKTLGDYGISNCDMENVVTNKLTI